MAGIDFIHQNGVDYEIVPEIAPRFKTTINYAAGDCVIYNAEAYRFKTAHSAGAWIGTDAEKFLVGEELGAIKEDLNAITEHHTPLDYTADVSASALVVGASALVGKVTCTDNENGGIDVINTSGVNGQIGFLLDDLPYGQNKVIDFTVELENPIGSVTVDLRTEMAQGSVGTRRTELTADSSGKYKVSFNLGAYNYNALGKLYLGYYLRYNQTTAVNIKVSAFENGDTERTLINIDAIQDLGFDNLSETLVSAIGSDSPTTYNGKQIATFNKGVAIGDSLTAGVFNHNEGGTNAYITNSAFAYPAKLEQLCGIDMTNLGNGGYTSDQWWTAHENDDLSGYQFAIIQLGVNDAIQYSGWTQTSITAFTNIINKVLTANNGIFVFVSTIIPATSYTGTAYDDVSDGIRNLVESINNDHVILLDMSEYGNTADEAGYNNGHLSALGYERLALDYISYISYVIAQNPVLFRYIQFIGTNHSYS